MLSVQTNTAAINTLNNLNKASTAQNKAMERLSSGFRINSAADDAAGFAIASKLQAQAKALTAASSNAAQANSMVKMADAGVNEIQNIALRLKTLATQAASSNNSGELTKLDAERAALEGQLTKLAQSSSYNGVKLLDGTAGTQTFQVGAQNAAYDQITANLGNSFTATGLGLGGAGADFTTTTNAQGYIATINTAIDTITTRRAALGATENALGYVNANLSSSIEQINSSVSVIKDANMAQEMANLSKTQILTQASTAMLAQANRSAQQILSLFR